VEIPVGSDAGRLRRWTKVILIPALLALLVGWLVSYAFPAKYTSQSLILVEGQRLPETMVQPVVSGGLTARIATLQQQVLGRSALQPVVERLRLSKTPEGVDDVIESIRGNMTIEPVPELTEIGTTVKETQAGMMQLGERMLVLNPASLPEDVDFPNRWLFAGGGLSAGLVFGIALALWLRYRGGTVRTAPIPSS
jgi:uncharacterized protein involved in exopolysaccharide biosynthesis